MRDMVAIGKQAWLALMNRKSDGTAPVSRANQAAAFDSIYRSTIPTISAEMGLARLQGSRRLRLDFSKVEVAPFSWTVCGLGSYELASTVCMLAS